jgi:hypothetical protein
MGKRGFGVVALIVLLHVVIYIVFVGQEWLMAGRAREAQMNATFYTPEVSASAEARGREWFTTLFVDTGVVGAMWSAMIPTEEDKRKPGMRDFAGSLFTWWETRLQTMWTVVYVALVRVAHLLLWWPYGLFVLAPFVLDGWVIRRIKQTDFSFASPLSHRMSLYLLQGIALGYFCAIFLPFALPPVLLPILILTTGWGLGKVFANFAKQA